MILHMVLLQSLHNMLSCRHISMIMMVDGMNLNYVKLIGLLVIKILMIWLNINQDNINNKKFSLLKNGMELGHWIILNVNIIELQLKFIIIMLKILYIIQYTTLMLALIIIGILHQLLIIFKCYQYVVIFKLILLMQ